MDKRAWILFGTATVAILAGLIFFSRQDGVDVSTVDAGKPITSNKVEETQSGLPDNVYGKKDSKVVLIEYGDYSCPGCASLEERMRPIMEEYEDRVAFVFRHFPLSTIHPNSRTAAAYAEAAGLQGKYWEMQDKLFKNQKAWMQLSANERDEKLKGYARELNLDLEQLDKDLTDERIASKIRFDMEVGKKEGVTGTPSLFLNGKMLNPEDFNDEKAVKSLLDEALKNAK